MNNFMQHIKITSELIDKKINCELKDLNITASQMRILIEIHKRNTDGDGTEILMKDLEKVFNLTQATIQGTVSRMEKKGYLETYHIPRDKRVKGIRLTDNGENLVNLALDKIALVQNKIYTDFTDDEASSFIYLMDKICDAVR